MSPGSTSVMPAADAARSARWRILALLFICRASLGFQFQALGSTAEPLVGQFGLSYTEIGGLIGLFMLPGLVLSLPAGWAARRASDRQLVCLGLGLLAAGSAVAAVAQGFGHLALARLLSGAGFVFATLYFTKMVVDWFAGLELATALGILVMSWPLGIAIGQVGHAWLADTGHWRWAFLAACTSGIAAAVAVAIGYRPPTLAVQAPAQGAGLRRAEWWLTALAAVVWGLFNAGYVVYLSFAPKVLMTRGFSGTDAAAVISLASWVMVFSVTLVGRLADRTGRHATVLGLCLAVGAASLWWLPMGLEPVVASLAFGLIGAAPAGIIMALTAQAMAPERRAFGMGVFYSLYFVFMAIAPPVAGWLFDRSARADLALWFGAALFVATGVGYAAFAPLRRRLSPG